MWLPRWNRMFGLARLGNTHVKRQRHLERICRGLHFDYPYKRFEVEHVINSYGVHNVPAFFDALIEYGYVEFDHMVHMYYLKKKHLSVDEFRELELRDKRKKQWWISWP